MTLFEESDVQPAAPSGPLVRVRMTIAYDGSGFKGFAVNRNVTTIAGELTEALAKVTRAPVAELVGAGRTDAGVHAWGQVVHADLAADGFAHAGGEEGLRRRLLKLLGPSRIVVRSLDVAPEGFHARFSATGRSYRYTIVNRDAPDPFLAATAWWVPEQLDVPAMRLACDPLIGEHDFSAFCRKAVGMDGEEKTLVRRVTDARWVEGKDEAAGILRFEIGANAFCHQQVRSIVGLLVEVGRGKRKAGEVAGIVRSKDRQQAGRPAPPVGLCLWSVTYGENFSRSAQTDRKP